MGVSAAEAEIEDTVVGIAERHGYVARKVQWIGRRGAPDRVFFGHGRCIWIEFKAPGEYPEGQQARELDRLTEAYGHVYVCHTVGSALRILGLPGRGEP